MIGTRRRSPLRVLSVGNERYRVGAWRGAPDVGYIAPITTTTGYGVARATDALAEQGYRTIITAALSPAEQRVFLQGDFAIYERLHLLRHELSILPNHGDRHDRIRRAKRRDRAEVLRIDHAAFDTFWRLDDHGLNEALGATPVSRFRVIGNGGVDGYSVSGRAGTIGYLQRLAVDPSAQGAGNGYNLVSDVLHWSRRHRCSAVLVNTQERNERAFSLYESMGFAVVPEGLAVLERRL